MDELILISAMLENYLYTGKPNETLGEVDTDDDEDETSMEEEHTTINKTKYLLTPLYYDSMSTNFVFNGVTKKIRAPNTLRERETYTMNAITLDELERFKALSIRSLNNDIVGIQGTELDTMVIDVIRQCIKFDEKEHFWFSYKLEADVLIQSIENLADALPIREDMSCDKFDCLNTPKTLLESLYQIATGMCNAFRQANTSMNMIRASLMSLPGFFNAMMEIFGNPDDVKCKNMWDLVFKTLNEASKKCVDAANKFYNSFEMVIQDIDELMDFLDDLPYYERKYTKFYYLKMIELKERFKLKQEEYVKKMNRDKKAFEDAKNNVEKALKAYRRKTRNMIKHYDIQSSNEEKLRKKARTIAVNIIRTLKFNTLFVGQIDGGKSSNLLQIFFQKIFEEEAKNSMSNYFESCKLTNYSARMKEFEDDRSEKVSNKRSATQLAKTYTNENMKHRIKLIDTPGLNDAGGAKQDKKKTKFLESLTKVEYLQAAIDQRGDDRIQDDFINYRKSKEMLQNGYFTQKLIFHDKLHLYKPPNKETKLKFAMLPDKKSPNYDKKLEYKELKTFTVLSHPNIVDLYRFLDRPDQSLVIHMDGSLTDLYKQFHQNMNKFPEELLGAISVSIIDALRVLRDAKIMHSDIKPDNILITSSGEIKIADFGLAKIVENSITNSYTGTERYMPQEFFNDTTPLESYSYDFSHDIWSLGISLIEAAYGKIPYDTGINENYSIGKSYSKLVQTITNEKLIQKCFRSQKISNKTKNFFLLCLKRDLSKRIEPECLMDTDFYKYFSSNQNKKYIQKLFDKIKSKGFYWNNREIEKEIFTNSVVNNILCMPPKSLVDAKSLKSYSYVAFRDIYICLRIYVEFLYMIYKSCSKKFLYGCSLSSPLFSLLLIFCLSQNIGLASASVYSLKASNKNNPLCEYSGENEECLLCEKYYMTLKNSDAKICIKGCYRFQFGIYIGERIECRNCSSACVDGCRGPDLVISENGCNRCNYGVVDSHDGHKTCIDVPSESKTICPAGYFFEKANKEESNWTNKICRPCNPECASCISPGSHPVKDKCVCKNYLAIDYRNETGKKICLNECPKGFIELLSLNHVSKNLCIRCKDDEHRIDQLSSMCIPSPKENYLIWALILLSLMILGLGCLYIGVFHRDFIAKYTSRFKQQKQNPKHDSQFSFDSARPLVDMKKHDENFYISEDQLKFNDNSNSLIGVGAYGPVYKGKLMTRKKEKDVAIKVIDTSKSDQDKVLESILKRAGLIHDHVHHILGVCINKYIPTQIKIITPLRISNLTEYLKNDKKKFDKWMQYTFCAQIASGMSFLAKHGIVHKNLSSCSILVKDSDHIEISSFGINLVNCLNIKHEGWRWRALENLTDVPTQNYTHHSDVWSYGITCWEIFTYCETPYKSITKMNDLKTFLESNKRLEKPLLCDNHTFNLILSCWSFNPHSRPNFEELHSRFVDIETEIKRGRKPTNETIINIEAPSSSKSIKPVLKVKVETNEKPMPTIKKITQEYINLPPVNNWSSSEEEKDSGIEKDYGIDERSTNAIVEQEPTYSSKDTLTYVNISAKNHKTNTTKNEKDLKHETTHKNLDFISEILQDMPLLDETGRSSRAKRNYHKTENDML